MNLPLMPSLLERIPLAIRGTGSGKLGPVLLAKAGILGFAILSVWLLPCFDYHQYWSIPTRWPGNGPTWLTPLTTWDAAHYLYLSQHGYHAGEPSCAFYPLWPFLIRVAQPVALGSPVLAGFLLANTFAILAVRNFHKLAKDICDCETASRAVILMLAFPGSLFFHFIYSESLFLFLSILFFSALLREDYKTVGIAGFLLPLTKASGMFSMPALALWLVLKRKPLTNWLVLLGPVYGLVTYFGVMYLFTDNPFEGFNAEGRFPNHPSLANSVNIPGFMRALADFGHLHGILDSALDRILFFILLAFLPAIWRLNRHFFFYSLAVGLLPAMCAWFVAYNRFIVMCFPLFIVAAKYLNDERRGVFWHFTILLGTIQVWFLIRHVNFLWAG